MDVRTGGPSKHEHEHGESNTGAAGVDQSRLEPRIILLRFEVPHGKLHTQHSPRERPFRESDSLGDRYDLDADW